MFGVRAISTMKFSAIGGEALFDDPGTFTWICPDDVTSVSAICVGGGGGGGQNGSITSSGGTASYFISTSTVSANGGNASGTSAGGAGGSRGVGGVGLGDGGGAGGSGVVGGGSAGSYNGAGSNGVNWNTDGLSGVNGSGAGGASGDNTAYRSGGGGGGTGVWGQGANGTSGAYSSGGGGGGSGANPGDNGEYSPSTLVKGGNGGWPGGGAAGAWAIGWAGGGGGLAYRNNIPVTPGQSYTVVVGSGGIPTGASPEKVGRGAGGVVRLIWGSGKSFPSNATGQINIPKLKVIGNETTSASLITGRTIPMGSVVAFTGVNFNQTYGPSLLFNTSTGGYADLSIDNYVSTQTTWTSEFRVRPTVAGADCFAIHAHVPNGAGNPGYAGLRVDLQAATGGFRFRFLSSSTGISWGNFTADNAVTRPFNEWYHVAVVQNSGVIKIFVDGILVYTSASVSIFRTGRILVGNFATATAYGTARFRGHFSHIRYYENFAKYTADFTPNS